MNQQQQTKQAPKRPLAPDTDQGSNKVTGPSEPTAQVPAVMTEESRAKALAMQSRDQASAWGDIPKLTAKDVIIPRILLMQGMSDLVMEGKAMFGEFRESLNSELLGKFEVGFDFVPFHMEKVWIEFKVENEGGKEKRTFLRSVPITPENETLPYVDEGLEEKTGMIVPIGRDRTMNFYVLLSKELELGSSTPYILSFAKTSLNAGKKLATQMYMKNINSGKTPASMVVQAFAKKESNDKGTYAVWDLKPVQQTQAEWISEAFKWLTTVKAGQVKTHDVIDTREVGPVPEGTGKF